MQNKSHIIAVVSVCVILIFISDLTFAKIFFSKHKGTYIAVNMEQTAKPLAAPATQVPNPRSISLKDSDKFTIIKFEDTLLEKIPKDARSKYEFTTFAEGTKDILLAGSAKDDKSIGIIYSLKTDYHSLKPDVKEYSFPGKGPITFISSVERDKVITFCCGNEEKGYLKLTDDSTIFKNYYLEALKKNPYFEPDTYEFKDLKESTVNITKDEAIERAVKKATVENIIEKSKEISAVLVNYTNKKNPEIAGSEITLEDCPVWIVTFSGIDVKPNRNTSSGDILTDMHLFIGANSGVWLGSVSHPSLQHISQ